MVVGLEPSNSMHFPGVGGNSGGRKRDNRLRKGMGESYLAQGVSCYHRTVTAIQGKMPTHLPDLPDNVKGCYGYHEIGIWDTT